MCKEFLRSIMKACRRKRPVEIVPPAHASLIEAMEATSRDTAIKSADTVRSTADRAMNRVAERHNQTAMVGQT